MTRRETRVVVIRSPGHSGHTWLCLLLGSHPSAFAAGELTGARGELVEEGRCMVCPGACSFWDGFAEVWDDSRNFFRQLSAYAELPTIVVSRIGEYGDDLEADRVSVRHIRMVRDGRAVTASWYRKYAEAGYRAQVHRFVGAMERIESDLPEGREDALTVRYEDLLAAPAEVLSEVCRFVGLDFRSSMLRYWESAHHLSIGNRGTVDFIRRHQGIESKDEERPVDASFYERQSPSRFRDERWRRELGPRELLEFERLAGDVNRRYGYERSQIRLATTRRAFGWLAARGRRLRRLLRRGDARGGGSRR